jgi:hypothetical protein
VEKINSKSNNRRELYNGTADCQKKKCICVNGIF